MIFNETTTLRIMIENIFLSQTEYIKEILKFQIRRRLGIFLDLKNKGRAKDNVSLVLTTVHAVLSLHKIGQILSSPDIHPNSFSQF